jgi:hypothetical protein
LIDLSAQLTDALAGGSWDRAACKDDTPPPPLTPALQARMDAKQAEYAFLAGAMAKMGDCEPSMPCH